MNPHINHAMVFPDDMRAFSISGYFWKIKIVKNPTMWRNVGADRVP